MKCFQTSSNLFYHEIEEVRTCVSFCRGVINILKGLSFQMAKVTAYNLHMQRCCDQIDLLKNILLCAHKRLSQELLALMPLDGYHVTID